MGYSTWDHKQLDTTEQLTLSLFTFIYGTSLNKFSEVTFPEQK